MLMNKDKEFMKLSFKNIDSFHKNAVKYLKINDANIPEELSEAADEQVESALFDQVEKAMKNMWGDKHMSSDFAANPDNDLSFNMMPVNALQDIFLYNMTTQYELDEYKYKYEMATNLT